MQQSKLTRLLQTQNKKNEKEEAKAAKRAAAEAAASAAKAAKQTAWYEDNCARHKALAEQAAEKAESDNWNEDNPAYWVRKQRHWKRPIDEAKVRIQRAVYWWHHEMQHTKDTDALAALRNLKTRLLPADLQLILTVPDTIRHSMLASD